jgi:cysteine desulfurase
MHDLSLANVEPRWNVFGSGGTSPAIYLDHHATTPTDPRVASIVLNAMANTFGNANSVEHTYGDAALDLVERAAAEVANLAGCEIPGIQFTSGSTESIRLAIGHAIATRRNRSLRVAATRVEHQAVLDTLRIAARAGAAEVTWIDVDGQAGKPRGSTERKGRPCLRHGGKQ